LLQGDQQQHYFVLGMVRQVSGPGSGHPELYFRTNSAMELQNRSRHSPCTSLLLCFTAILPFSA